MFLKRLCVALLTLDICLATRVEDICNVPTQSCGPVPPTLPESFIIKGSKLDLRNDNSYSWFEEYFDPGNLRGKYVEVSKGIETHMIFDYHTQQIISYFYIHQGGRFDQSVFESVTCKVEDMSDSQFTAILGKKFGYYDPLRPRMYNAYESMRYGGPYPYAYDSQRTVDSDRQVPCLTFRGCIYDENEDTTLNMTFVWLGAEFSPAFNTDQVLLRIQERGGYFTKSGNSNPVWFIVDTDKTVAWFEANPYMGDEIFQPPVRMDCKNMRETVTTTVPTIPLAFSVRMETFVTTEHWSGERISLTQDQYQEVWFDSGRKLVRHDHMPSSSLLEEIDMFLAFDKLSTVTAVHDFNTGLSFYTDKVQGMCVVLPIGHDDFVLSKQSTKDGVVMASPHEILSMDTKLKYKGKYHMRDMECNGYSVQVEENNKNSKDPLPLLHEIYFSTDGWHENVKGKSVFGLPLRDIQAYSVTVEGQEAETIADTNYYAYQSIAPSLSVYDISGCALHMRKKYFKVDLNMVSSSLEGQSVEQVVDSQRDIILYKVQILLTEGADLGSPLRIQDLRINNKPDGQVGLSFTLLDIFNVSGSVSDPLRGQDLNSAKDTLTTKVNTGTAIFKIQLSFEETVQEQAEFILVPKTLVEIKITETYIDLSAQTDETKAKELQGDEGYSKGALAGLAIGMLALGLGIGGIAILLYFKKFMRPRRDTETANFVMTEST